MNFPYLERNRSVAVRTCPICDTGWSEAVLCCGCGYDGTDHSLAVMQARLSEQRRAALTRQWIGIALLVLVVPGSLLAALDLVVIMIVVLMVVVALMAGAVLAVTGTVQLARVNRRLRVVRERQQLPAARIVER